MALSSSDIHPLYKSKKRCLCCNYEFSVLKVRSRYYITNEIEKDFRVKYKEKDVMVEPFLYNVFVCENCGFAFTDKFSSYFKVGKKEEVKEKISSFWSKRSYCKELDLKDGLTIYNLAVYSARLKEEGSFVIGNLYLHLSWLYKDLNDDLNYKKSIALCLKYYLESYSNGDYSQHNYTEYYILYMISYFYYILENYKESSFYLSKIIMKQGSISNKALLDYTLDLWEEVRIYIS